MFDFSNVTIQYQLDLATALSVMIAAMTYVISAIRLSAREKAARKKEMIKQRVLAVADLVAHETRLVVTEIGNIELKVRSGQLQMDLDHFAVMLRRLPLCIEWLDPLDRVYGGNGAFEELRINFTKQIDEFLTDFHNLTSGNSNQKWSFEEVMSRPRRIAVDLVTSLYKTTEKLFDQDD